LHSQIAHFEAANDLIGSASRFHEGRVSVKVVATTACGGSMRPWREVTAELVGQSDLCKCDAEEVILIIARKVATNATLASRLDEDGPPDGIFRGMLHSSVCLASLINPPNAFETDGSNEYVVSSVSQYVPMH
jgi:hypothetical protein